MSNNMPSEPPESVYTSKTEVACDGADSALGHPRVYLHMDDNGQVECPYCDRLFILQKKSD